MKCPICRQAIEESFSRAIEHQGAHALPQYHVHINRQSSRIMAAAPGPEAIAAESANTVGETAASAGPDASAAEPTAPPAEAAPVDSVDGAPVPQNLKPLNP